MTAQTAFRGRVFTRVATALLALLPACSEENAAFSDATPMDARADVSPPDVAMEAAVFDRPDVAVSAPDVAMSAPDVASDTPSAPVDVIEIDLAPPPPPPPAEDVEVIITADNAYSFGYGDETAISTWVNGRRAMLAGEIFNCPVGNGPERHIVPAASAPDSAYVYVVSWDDLAVTQGVIGQFRRGTRGAPIYTGAAGWEVCGTGIDLSRSTTGPTQSDVNGQIVRCNAGSGDTQTSRGWVNLMGAVTPGAVGALAVGEPNDGPGGDFQLVCPASMGGIDEAARWMWYQPGGVANPFRSTGSNVFHAYLIFRLRVGNIPSVIHG